MSKKLYIGIAAGILIGISIPALLKFKREEELFSDEDLSDENDMLHRANHYLKLAKSKVDEMVTEAEQKSNSYLTEAGKILSLAKEKTSAIHFEHNNLAEEEIDKIKAEVDRSIEKFKREFNN
ncbi:MAG: hypothetical protein IPL53_24460 [Ignavibacteria bacterium]|nr:hypothetical protein [Ignavibacteria bacterium]